MPESVDFWRVLCTLGLVCASLCANEAEYDGNYVDGFDNEISQERQEGETTATPCQAAELSRWDKLFIAVEDSHMRQNMLLESVGQCCVGTASVRNQLEKLLRGGLPRLESTCRSQAEQAAALLQRGLAEMSQGAAAREGAVDAALRQLLQRQGEEARSGTRAQPTRPPPEERDTATPPPLAAMEKALVVIATELQKVHLRLAAVIQQAGTFREARGDT